MNEGWHDYAPTGTGKRWRPEALFSDPRRIVSERQIRNLSSLPRL